MNDRLADIPTWVIDDSDDNLGSGDVELGDLESGGDDTRMKQFFREVESIENDIEAIRKATKVIGDINNETLQAVTTEEENESHFLLRPLVDQTNAKAKRAKTLLSALREETKKLHDKKTLKQIDLR